MKVFIDIETLPPAGCGHAGCNPQEPCPDEDYRKLALKPEFGRVLCVGLLIEDGGTVVQQGVLGRDRTTLIFHLDERRLIRSLWHLLRNFNPRSDVIVGHNVLDFDLPFLYRRSIIHNIQPAFKVSFARYRCQEIFDTMWMWGNWRDKVSLATLAKALGLQRSKDGVDGSQIYDLFMQNRHVEIAEYCMRDVHLTREIYYRLNFITLEVISGEVPLSTHDISMKGID